MTNDHPATKTAIVTAGAGAGVGGGITRVLAAQGWNVMITARREAVGQPLVDELNEAGFATAMILADVTEPGAAARIVRETVERFGQLHGLVNNAGVGLTKKIHEATDEDFLNLFSVDFMGPLQLIREAIPHLRRTRGSIINIGSVHVHGGAVNYSHYAATKCALEGLTRGIAIDYGKDGIRANIVHPGLVDSPQNEELVASFASDPAKWLHDFAESKQCIPELVTAEQVGEMVAYLLSDAARTVTGQRFFIDGGLTALLWNNENDA